MLQNAHGRLFVVLLLALGVFVCEAQAGGASPLTIRIFDSASADAQGRLAAIETAAAIVADAGMAVAWHDCTGEAQRRQCHAARGARDLIVRIVPTFVPWSSAPRGAVETRLRADAPGVVLGFAVVEAPTGAGALATIFMDRVRAVARRTTAPPAALLGRAIAHEVGHLLLGTNAHSRSGLMREIWTDAEIFLDRPEDWRFAPTERRLLQRVSPGPA
jgi:hypothetical protein